MPLVVSSLMGDASNVFNWILSLNPGNTQDLTTLLQMLREHYYGSLTFREQRNTIENLCQKPQEAAIDFLIRVGTSMSNLGKDWKDELTDEELQSLQYEVSLNGVHEDARSRKLVFPLTMQTALFCITCCLHFSCCPRCALVWGTVVRGFACRDLCQGLTFIKSKS